MDILFLIAGIIFFFKKEIKISSKRTLTGRPVKILAALYILPFIYNFALGFISQLTHRNPVGSGLYVSLALIIIAIIATLYFILFYRNTEKAAPAPVTTSQNNQSL
jgi:hypothetical protein